MPVLAATRPAAAPALAPLLHTIAGYLNAEPAPALATFGVGTGKGGTILFNCHYAAFTGDARYYDRALAELEQVLALLNPQTYKADFGSNFYQELLELGELLCYLGRHGHLDWDSEPLLRQIDTIQQERLTQFLATANLERRRGALAVGAYFLRRAPHSALAREQLHRLLDSLETLRQGDEEGGYYWVCHVIAEPRAYTGLSHGSGMVMSFLADLHAAGIRPEACERLLHYAARWLLGTRMDPAQFISTFPLWAGKADETNNLCLIYGDLGTAYALLRAAELLDNEEYRTAALAAAHCTTARTSAADTHIRDASIYYGAAGTYLLYDALYQLAGAEEFAQAARYWLARIPGFATHDNDYLGFSPQFYRTYEAAQLGFGFGVVGIGLTLLQALSGGRYSLSEFIGLT